MSLTLGRHTKESMSLILVMLNLLSNVRKGPYSYCRPREESNKANIIRKSNYPLCLVMKPNGKVRPGINYRAINKLTKPDCFPISNTKDCLDVFARAKLFSTFDLMVEYHQVPIMETGVSKTAFISKYRLYEHLTMPMGMMNS